MPWDLGELTVDELSTATAAIRELRKQQAKG
jgi:hypothetical protein